MWVSSPDSSLRLAKVAALAEESHRRAEAACRGEGRPDAACTESARLRVSAADADRASTRYANARSYAIRTVWIGPLAIIGFFLLIQQYARGRGIPFLSPPGRNRD